MDLSRWIARNAAWRPHWPALVFADEPISYRALDAGIAQLAAALAGTFAVKRGDRIAVLSYNRPEYVALIFAAARIGAIVVPLNWRLAPPEHGQILADADPALLVVDGDLQARAEDLARMAPRAHRAAIDFALDGWTELADACDAAGPPPAPVGRPEDPVLLVYTSGTTGRPKGAVLTQGAVTWNAVNSVWAHDFTSEDRILTTLPLFHVGGLNIQTLPALHAGATVLLHKRFAPAEMLAAIARDRPTVTLLVPAVMKALTEHPQWERADLSSLRLAMAGSSVVPVELIRPFHARGVPVGQVYGATETGPVSIVLRGLDAMRKEGACGTPAIHCDARIVDDRDEDVKPGERGEILLRGPHITQGYWRDSASTSAAFLGGWFRTGDIGHQDEDGHFWVDDRKKDMIISGGENIYPAELEAVLETDPTIAEAAVVARPDAKWGEVPVAIVVPRAGAAVDPDAVKARFAGRLAKFKHPHDVVIVDSLPRNAMGKVLRYVLRETLRG